MSIKESPSYASYVKQLSTESVVPYKQDCWPSGHGPGFRYLRCIAYPIRYNRVKPRDRLAAPDYWLNLDHHYTNIQLLVNPEQEHRYVTTPKSNVLLDASSTNKYEDGIPGLIRCSMYKGLDAENAVVVLVPQLTDSLYLKVMLSDIRDHSDNLYCT
jgi:hypothetical protein